MKLIDRLELQVAKEVDESLCRDLGMRNSDIKVTVEVNQPFLMVEVAATGCIYHKHPNGFRVHGAILRALTSMGVSVSPRKSEYRYREGVHYWSTLFNINEEICDFRGHAAPQRHYNKHCGGAKICGGQDQRHYNKHCECNRCQSRHEEYFGPQKACHEACHGDKDVYDYLNHLHIKSKCPSRAWSLYY